MRQNRTLAFDSFEDGVQETHCRNLVKAKAKRFDKEFSEIMDSHPLTQRTNNGVKTDSFFDKISE